MLRLNNNSCINFTSGEMVNLMAVDTQKFVDLMPLVNITWSAPMRIFIAFGFLYNILGWPALIGFIFLILSVPLTSWIAKKVRSCQAKQMKLKDRRSRIMSEILSGVKVMKMYAWETSFMHEINKCRREELKHVRAINRMSAITLFVMRCAPTFVAIITFTVYVLVGYELTAEKAFVAVSLFNIMRSPLTRIPYLINGIVKYIVALKRLEKFLQAGELELTDIERTSSVLSGSAIRIEDGTFSWGQTTPPTLDNVNVNIAKGTLVGIVGKVGSGKSTLLASMLGEVGMLKGRVEIYGSVAYVPQLAWIQNDTLSNNILFSEEYLPRKYSRIKDVCALQPDIDILPHGDRTEIGEKGINLSGGQKQRVSLARAVYANADVYLLDDPLSAVDALVGRQLLDEVIGQKGLLQNKVSDQSIYIYIEANIYLFVQWLH